MVFLFVKMKCQVGIIVIGALVFFIGCASSDDLPELDFTDNWNHEIKPHNIPFLSFSSRNHSLPLPARIHYIMSMLKPKKNSRKVKTMGNAVQSKITCPVCKMVAGLLVKELKKGTTMEGLEVKFINLCVSFKIETPEVCKGLFDVYGAEVIAAFSRTKITPEEGCSLLMGEICGDVKVPSHQWNLTFPNKGKPWGNKPKPFKEGAPTFKILQISDTHLDPLYVEGSISNCDEPLCCRENSTPTKNKTIPAGKWGAYAKCDSPKAILENLFAHIKEQHPDIDFILWTGDLPPHDIWNQTRETNLKVIRETTELVLKYFADKPIFPAIGNHESAPAGNFPPPWVPEKHSISWLYGVLVNQWGRWLPAQAQPTMMHGGFYSVLLRPKLRLISINTNYCHIFSWWLVVNSTDPAKELQWLIYELQEAEDADEKVLIIGHIPPGSYDCMKVWSENFNKIVNRYEYTIVGQFYGHSHADEFEVFYENENRTKATGVAFVCPSITTFENFNPGYRIYYLDGEHNETTQELVDYETWSVDLEEANKTDGTPKWFKLYSARRDYDLSTLKAADWSEFIDKMVKDPYTFQRFYKNYYRNSPTRPPCDDMNCRLQILCDLRSGRSHVRHKLCHDLELTFSVY